MNNKPQMMDVGGGAAPFPPTSPKPTLVESNRSEQQHTAAPSKILFDGGGAPGIPDAPVITRPEGAEMSKPDVHCPEETEAKSKMVSRMLSLLQQSETPFRSAPDVSDIVLNADSSLNEQKTLESPCIISEISEKLNHTFDEMVSLSRMEDGLSNYADAEKDTKERVPVQFNIMVGNIVIRNVSCYSGDKIVFPTPEDITASMGSKWNPELFVGWDSDGIAYGNNDVHAILKRSCQVSLKLSGNLMCTVSTPEGTKVIKIVEDNMKRINLVAPLFTNYSVYCTSRVITGDATINLEPKNRNAAEIPLEKKQFVVVFAIKPSWLGIDTSNMTKEELQNATVISKMVVSYGDAANAPTDEQLLEHGMSLPFEKYYRWSADFSAVTSNLVIKAVPLTAPEGPPSLIETIRGMSKEDLVEGGAIFAKHFMNILANPAIEFREKKLLRNFEDCRPLRTRDFVFLRRGTELMLYQYIGPSLNVEIPSSVNGLYVNYIHPCAFSDGPITFRYIFKKNKNQFKTNSMSSRTNINQILFPNSIKYIPSNFLYKVTEVTAVVIPASVTEISPDAFNGASVEELYFDGVCPRGFNRENVRADVFVRRQNYKSFFQ